MFGKKSKQNKSSNEAMNGEMTKKNCGSNCCGGKKSSAKSSK